MNLVSSATVLRQPQPGRVSLGLALGGSAVLLGVGLAVLSWSEPPPVGLALAAAVGLTALLALALASYDAAVAVGFLLLGVVLVEPSPPDAVFALLIAVALVTRRLSLARVPFLASGLITVFLALNLLSATGVADWGAASRFFLITLYLAVFAVWLACYINTVARARLVVGAYVAGAAAVAIGASLALFVPLPGADLLLTDDGARAKGLFKDANVFGPFLVPAAFVLIEELLQPRLLQLRALTKWALLIVLAAGILLSFSRGAWLNVAVGLSIMVVVLLLRRGGGRRALLLLLVALSLTVALTTLIAVTGSGEFLVERARGQTYDVSRFSAQSAAIDLAQEHPIGLGPGQWELTVPLAAHSLYARVLAEQGLLGLMAMFGLINGTLVLAARNAVLGRDTYGIGSAALLGAWSGLLVNSAVIDTLHWRHLWVVAALIWAGAIRSAPPRQLRAAPAPSSAGGA